MVILGAVTLDRDASSVGLGRRYVNALLELEEVDPDSIVLIVSELLTNAVDHGGGETMELLAAADEDRIRIEVADAGGAATTPGLAQIDQAESETGRGLRLVAWLSEEWGVRNAPGRTTVWAELLRKPSC